MNVRLPLLVASGLLTGLVSACTSHSDPQPSAAQPTSSASYTLDGQVRTCTVAQGTTSAQGYDFLTLSLTTTPQPSSGPEVLSLNLRKPTGQPTSAYEYMPVGSLLVDTGGNKSPYDFQHTSPLPTFTSQSISGTFAGKMAVSPSSGTYLVLHTIQAGTYTLVLP